MPQRPVSGFRFTAKWSGTPMVVEDMLGEGANGAVYRVRTPLGKAAMKVCTSSSDIAMEWSLLTSLGQGASAFPKPMLIDDGPAEAPFFYVMEWIPGISLHRVMENRDFGTAVKAFEAIIRALTNLHAAGYAFCDLKPENVMVTHAPSGVAIRFVDVGGVTKFGRPVRQYTPLCDRAFFGMGSRKAEPSYDLYALLLGLASSSLSGQSRNLAKEDPLRRRRIVLQSMREFPVEGIEMMFADLEQHNIHDAFELWQAWNLLPERARRVRLNSSRRRKSGASSARVQWTSATPGTSRQSTTATSSTFGTPRPHTYGGPRGRKTDWTEWVMWVSLGSAGVTCLAAWGVLLGWLR